MTSEMIADIKTEDRTDTETMTANNVCPVICFTIDSWDSSDFKSLSKQTTIVTLKLHHGVHSLLSIFLKS